ncbi:hypothetical protein BCON_0510g00050 [Botryotinia convoluta]|uniref:Uncharacterized protein n=1 Tax=Botryotinia convoluta TaxID=54673 RepID=A0A4Z1HCQ7_9HELO|nr:hypothetical protein BCON_0510g00050 [Botryotinia convoluta]
MGIPGIMETPHFGRCAMSGSEKICPELRLRGSLDFELEFDAGRKHDRAYFSITVVHLIVVTLGCYFIPAMTYSIL